MFDPYYSIRTCTEKCPNISSTIGFGRGEPPQESPDAEWEPPVQWGFGMWAEAFRYLPSLKSVTIDFDTDTQGRSIMCETVAWASRVWRFPLGPRPDDFTYFSAQGNSVQ